MCDGDVVVTVATPPKNGMITFERKENLLQNGSYTTLCIKVIYKVRIYTDEKGFSERGLGT